MPGASMLGRAAPPPIYFTLARPAEHAEQSLMPRRRPGMHPTHLHDMLQHRRTRLLRQRLRGSDPPQHSQQTTSPHCTHPAPRAGPEAHQGVLLLPELAVLGKQCVPAARRGVGRVARVDELHCCCDAGLQERTFTTAAPTTLMPHMLHEKGGTTRCTAGTGGVMGAGVDRNRCGVEHSKA
jgi:hypothetical protein